jgi:hypothetical protein
LKLFDGTRDSSRHNVMHERAADRSHLHGVGAAEHGQLPHCPVPVVEVVLQAREQQTGQVSICRQQHANRDLVLGNFTMATQLGKRATELGIINTK